MRGFDISLMPKPEQNLKAAPQGAAIAVMTIALLLGGFVLYAAIEVVPHAPCWTVLPLAALIAVPVWLALRESALLTRRALLDGTLLNGEATKNGMVADRLRKGHLTSALVLVVAIVLCVLLLAMGTLLSRAQWVVLFASALLLPWLYAGYRRHLKAEVQAEVLGIVTRRWPLRLSNMALIAMAFFVIDFAITGAADTRLADWRLIMEQTFATQSAQARCPVMGALLGGFAVIDQLSWHWAQRVIPHLPDLPMQIGAWLLVLLRLGLVAVTFTLYLTGLLVLVEGRSRPMDAVVGVDTLAKTWVLTILVLALPVLYASLTLRELDLEAFQRLPEPIAMHLDPCQPDAEAQAALRAELDGDLARQLDAIDQDMATRVDRRVDRLFATLEVGVDAYLDWYFTVIGEYQRLGAMMAGNIPELMAEQLEQHVFADRDFEAELVAINAQTLELAEARLDGIARGFGQRLSHWQATPGCRAGLLNLGEVGRLNRDGLRALSAAGLGTVSGATVIAAATLSKTVTAKVVAKVAGKKSFQLGATLLGKVAAKKGASVGAAAVGGTALCAPAGLGAVACGIGAAVVTWLAADKAFVEIDEALSREDMRADILEALNSDKQRLKDSLNAQHQAWLLQVGGDLQTTLNSSFVPMRDGLR